MGLSRETTPNRHPSLEITMDIVFPPFCHPPPFLLLHTFRCFQKINGGTPRRFELCLLFIIYLYIYIEWTTNQTQIVAASPHLFLENTKRYGGGGRGGWKKGGNTIPIVISRDGWRFGVVSRERPKVVWIYNMCCVFFNIYVRIFFHPILYNT